MDTPTIVNIILCVLSFILAAISVITVIISLRQNSKMIEESTRPYISIYLGSTYFQNTISYLILKNYGSSSAIIDEFFYDFDLSKCAYDLKAVPFSHIKGTRVSPGESLIYPLDLSKLGNSEKLSIHFNISYSSSLKKYTDTITLNLSAHFDMVHLRANTKNQELKIISYTLQDIAEKML